jgi:hypothetical protein
MSPMKRILPLLLVVALAAVIQLAFIESESEPTPYQAAIDFANAYFRLDPSMANDLAMSGQPGQPSAPVASFLQRTMDQTAERGFGIGMAKSMLFDVKTETVQTSDTEARVHLTAIRRTAINPVFCLIGKFFNLGKSYPVDATITMCKQDGKWKVRLPVFDLALAGGQSVNSL